MTNAPADQRRWGAACADCGWHDDVPRTQRGAAEAVARHRATCQPDEGWAERANEADPVPCPPITYAYA